MITKEEIFDFTTDLLATLRQMEISAIGREKRIVWLEEKLEQLTNPLMSTCVDLTNPPDDKP